ncbi:FKBP-type peptidyl-prolyl cis-trans isomerase SlyD [Stenotrophomonas sp. SORGH_AS282]|nr:FKBP-type peptidyl-prolyl cis-trans isomerase SlyD [Stenotrophomonas sp. SORGH_AS_0282]MDQ1189664.1 FKBP-type peptidyl-prolyl cis-trans isomerase SlyD [Stenotrophomonas sp. SORGH_AS_0282]
MMAAYLAGDNPSHPSALAASAQEFRMKIEKDRVVRFHYTVAEQGQEPIESSRDRDPLAILIGHGNIIPGLEAAMLDKEAGASFEVDVKAADAYGERKEGLSQRVPKKHFGETRLVKGQQVVLQTNFGPRAVTVEKVGMSVVDVDLNHPMAGKDLHFSVEIVDVREAAAEELEHGHVHGDGGLQH